MLFRSILPGVFYHVALTYDGSAIKIYLNGVLKASGALSGSIRNTTFPFLIGRRSGAGVDGQGDVLNGLIDEVHIFDRALSAAEVAATFNASSAGYIQSDVEIDFSAAANPNGLWRYGESVTLGSTFSLLPNSNPGSPIESWGNNATSGAFISHNTALTPITSGTVFWDRSEERRVGKECRL